MKLNQMARRAALAGVSTLLVVAMSSCSTQGPTIDISKGSWSAVPATMAYDGQSFRVTITNNGNERQEFVVVGIFEGSPDALPVSNGVLDIGRSGISADPESPGVALFGLDYPAWNKTGDGAAGFEPATIDPGETQSVVIGSSLLGGGGPGTYVVLSYLPGGYEQGDYAVFTLTDPNG